MIFENSPGAGPPIPPALPPVEGIIPTTPTTILFQRHSRFTSKFPRKIGFKNIRKMIPESNRWQEIGLNSEKRIVFGVVPQKPPVGGVTPTTSCLIVFFCQRHQDSLNKSPRKRAFGNVRKMISGCLRLQQIGGIS